VECYSLALYEGTDASATIKLAIFVHGVDKNCNITEEMASLITLKDTKTVSNILEGIMATLNRLGLNLTNLSGVTAHGAPAMAGRTEGLVK
jgi:hypothetical protein